MTATETALRVVGAFYALAGFIVVRVALTSRVIDQAIAALGAGKPSTQENAQTLWHLGSSVVVFAGGVLLMLLLEAAVWMFLLSTAGQAAYLFWLAPRHFDPVDPPDTAGRRQTTNAFVIYTAATALVCWAALTDTLLAWQQVRWPWLAAAGTAIAGLAVYAVWMYARPTGSPSSGWPAADRPERSPDPARITRVQIVAEHGRHPLWAMDEDASGDIPPAALGLSPDLCRDLDAWAEAFSGSCDPAEPTKSLWTAAQHRAHGEAAYPLAERVKRERPDLAVCVADGGEGLREVPAS